MDKTFFAIAVEEKNGYTIQECPLALDFQPAEYDTEEEARRVRKKMDWAGVGLVILKCEVLDN